MIRIPRSLPDDRRAQPPRTAPRLLPILLLAAIVAWPAGPARGGTVDRGSLLTHRLQLPDPAPEVPAPAADPDLFAPPAPAAPARLERYRPKPPPGIAATSVAGHDDNEIGIEYALNQAGRLYEAAGEIDRALRSYRAAMLENPAFLLPYYNLARVYRALGMDDQVREVWRQLLKVNPDDRTANSELGLYYLNSQQFDLARPCFQNLVRLDPQDGFSMHNLGVTYAQAGDAEAAVGWFRRAVSSGAPLDYREVLPVAAFDRIRSDPAFRAFAVEVGAEQALAAATAAAPTILAAERRIADERLIPIAEELIGLATDQSAGRVYNVAMYNGPREVDGLPAERPAAVEGLAQAIQRSDAVMIVYSSSPEASTHMNDATILPLRQRAQAVGIDVQWFDRKGSADRMTSRAEGDGALMDLEIVGLLTLRAAAGAPPASQGPTPPPSLDAAPSDAIPPAAALVP